MSSPLGLHSFLGGVAAGSLSALVNNSVTTFPINTIVVANWPPLAIGPFKIVIDQGLSTEESCLVTAATTTSFTVTRAYDGSTAYAHANGATFYTAPEAEAVQDMAQHVYDTTRNDHTQYQLGANLVSGYGLSAMPTPAVQLTFASGAASNVSVGASTTVTVATTSSLGVGSWLIFVVHALTLPATDGGSLIASVVDGTAVATIVDSGATMGDTVTSEQGTFVMATEVATAVISTAGTLLLKVDNTDASAGGHDTLTWFAIRIA